jgi:LuxR family maltose regulon positive regulatory protein
MTEAVDLLTRFVEIGVILSYLSLARIRQVQGDWERTWDLLHQARQMAAESRSVQMDDRLVEVAQARFWIQQGRYDQALSWIKERRLDENTLAGIAAAAGSPGYDFVEPEYLLLARLYLARGFPAEALEILEALLAVDERKGRGRRIIEVLALQAVALEAAGEGDRALAVLQRALALGGPEGFARTFIDEGAPMRRLLQGAVQRGIEPEHAGRLLAALLEEEATGHRKPGITGKSPLPLPQIPSGKPQVGLIEPLSGRELEVLRLIAQGLSNSEIAARLVITLSTVKGHTANIYSKLAVNSRTQAAARARELGLI